MGDESAPSHTAGTVAHPPSNRRILVILAGVGFAGAAAGGLLISAAFGVGVLIGTGLAFLNFVWLRRSLRNIFESAAGGEKPRMLTAGYFVRYVVLALTVAAVYATGWVPVEALILGMAGFGVAAVFEGFIRIFSAIFGSKEI